MNNFILISLDVSHFQCAFVIFSKIRDADADAVVDGKIEFKGCYHMNITDNNNNSIKVS